MCLSRVLSGIHWNERRHSRLTSFSQTVAVLRGDSNVKGTVTFEQASEGAETTISWDITGNDANAERGMHVHAFGDNTNGCTSAGPHCEYCPQISVDRLAFPCMFPFFTCFPSYFQSGNGHSLGSCFIAYSD